MPEPTCPPADAPLELIAGPVRGWHLACYTVLDPAGHYAYAKVCSEPPQDVWDAGAVYGKLAAGPYPDPYRALAALSTRAQRVLRPRGAVLA